MKNTFLTLALVFVAIVLVGIWYLRSPDDDSTRNGTPQPRAVAEGIKPPADAPHQTGTAAGGITDERQNSEDRAAGSPQPDTGTAEGDTALRGIKSPIARRYLAFLLAKNGRLASESHSPSIVNNAFKQAWILISRMELSAEQQDRLADFLLEKDWLSWNVMEPAKIEAWAKQNLTVAQQATLKDFLAEQKGGAAHMEELKQAIQRLEHGNRSNEEILAAEMTTLQAFFSRDTVAPNSKPPIAAPMDADIQKKHADYVQTEQAFRFYNLLADRIPLTEVQHSKVYEALRSGAQAPINPYDYQTFGSVRAETAVHKDTVWLRDLLTNAQYETYVRHFLAEIEMTRFQSGR